MTKAAAEVLVTTEEVSMDVNEPNPRSVGLLRFLLMCGSQTKRSECFNKGGDVRDGK